LTKILLTGATGYVGGRLLKALEGRSDVALRCLTRRPEALKASASPSTEIVYGDTLDPASLVPALTGVHTAYYLVHQLGASQGFEALEERSASAFAEACRSAGVQRLIYLGGLSSGTALSPHLRSRQRVGEILRGCGIPVIEFRASVILGSGSLSFEMIRSLVERLPIMVTPRWVHTLTQPIGIEDVIDYLVSALELPAETRLYEIGSPDCVSYGELMREYARLRGLKRWMITVPVLTPRLSSLWLGLITPLYSRVGRKLIDSLRSPSVITDDRALQDFAIRPRGVRQAMERALLNEDRDFALTRWSDALSSAGSPPLWGGVSRGTRFIDSRVRDVAAPPVACFEPIRRIGGPTGWYFGNALWRLRGALDLLVGGVGLRRGRRDPEDLRAGDTLDFWRVETYDPPHRLRLIAEMKVPGRAWLEFDVEPIQGGSRIRQTAVFDARGLGGLLYWYALYPLHRIIFAGMLRNLPIKF